MALYGKFHRAAQEAAGPRGFVVGCSLMSKQKLAVVILAAGRGLRMKTDIPKVLHSVAGRPMIGYVLGAAQALDPDLMVAVLGPGMEAYADAFAPARIAVQAEPRGTGDAVMAARPVIGDFDGDVLVLFGDTPLLRPETLEAVRGALNDGSGAAVAVLGFRPADPGQYGRLITDSSGELEAIVEFGDASDEQKAIGLCNSGVMAVQGRHLFGLLEGLKPDNAKGEFYLTDIVAAARAQGLRCTAVEGGEEEPVGVNSRAEQAVAEAAMQLRLRAEAMAAGATLIDPTTVYFSFDTRLGHDVVIGPNVFFGPGVTIGDGVEIRAFSHIDGAEIGDGAIIGPFARLRPGAQIGEGVHIGNYVEIKAAVIEAGAKINHLSYVGDSRVGAETNIGAGTITCNYDGFDKHVTDIGAGVFIGSNTALVAPVIVGDGAVIGAGSVITGDVAPDALAVTRAKQTEIPDGGAGYRARKGGTKPSSTGKG